MLCAGLAVSPKEIGYRGDVSATCGEAGSLFGDYELLFEIGRGGMGIVYKARHRTLQRTVALKVTREARHLLSAEEAHRFHVEAAAVAKLDHPHIVPIYEVGEAHGRQFLAMAFVEGASLAEMVARQPLPQQRAAELMQQVAAAIAYAHAQGVIHRDLKPDNILLETTGRPRITDFGIAKFLDADSHLTLAGEVIGTPGYMPPEQAQARLDQVGPQSDVYALGATLYCLLTGRPPFQSASSMDTFHQVVNHDPVPPRQLNAAVAQDLETICLKCLEKRPERRYASAQALAVDLQLFLEHRPIHARRSRIIDKASRWCRRNPLPAWSAAIVVALFVTAFLLVSWNYWRAEEARGEEAYQRQQANVARDEAIKHEQAERWERYRANMATVCSAQASQFVATARRVLETAPAEHRN
jgi:serine/threonine protein kinase